MGKKRQRNAANGAEKAQPVSRENDAPVTKKRKKAPLQLKVIAMRGATTEKKADDVENVKPVVKEDTEEPMKKMKKKNKNNKKASGEASGESESNKEKEKTKKANTVEIDDLFQSLKTKKQENAQAAEKQKQEEARAKKKERKERERLEEQIKMLEAQNTNFTAVKGQNPDPRPVRYDEDGLPIYSEESLQIGKGGDTADCPFDCWCCF